MLVDYNFFRQFLQTQTYLNIKPLDHNDFLNFQLNFPL